MTSKIVFKEEPDVSDDDEESKFLNEEQDYVKLDKRVAIVKGDEEYKTLEEHQHILARPENFLGSVNTEKDAVYLVENGLILQKKLQFSAGFVHTFYEPLSNAADNVFRSSMKGIVSKKISVEVWADHIRIRNDGYTVPVKKQPGTKVYMPQYVFGTLRTGSNFNDSKERFYSGRNGYGVKLTNIFSDKFTIETRDSAQGLHYKQTWTNSMLNVEPPEITEVEQDLEGFTKLTWYPSFSRFPGVSEINSMYAAIFEKLCIDFAMLTGVNVTFTNHINGKTKTYLLNLEDYTKLYTGVDDVLYIESKDSRVTLFSSSDPFKLSFVNGIETRAGGIHLTRWSSALAKCVSAELTPLLNKGRKEKIELKTPQINKYFGYIVCCTLDKPVLKHQTKDKLISPAPTVAFTDAIIKQVKKWSIVETMIEDIELVDMKTLAKTAKKKKISKTLDDAELAGKEPNNCIFILTEGLSAKTSAITARLSSGFVMNGKTFKGSEHVGIDVVMGKLRNVYEASMKVILRGDPDKNFQLNFMKTLGAEIGIDYGIDENFWKLRYHQVGFLRDADNDGKHIEALFITMLRRFFPSLMNRTGFFGSVRTPIIYVERPYLRGFYTREAFQKAYPGALKKDDVHYMKGLGGMDDDMVKEYLGNFSIIYDEGEESKQMVHLTMGKKDTDWRKEWIAEASRGEIEQASQEPVRNFIQVQSYASFLHTDLVWFAIEANERAIPGIDGFKDSQRKIYYTAEFEKITGKKFIKVAQLQGATARLCDYSHGENNLCGVIVNMAQDYPGSNNFPLFFGKGQFGSRLENGADQTAPRYAHVTIRHMATLLFRKEDLPVLSYKVCDDGHTAEPVLYAPILPLILLNGAMGIGMGWATTIHPHLFADVANAVRTWIAAGCKSRKGLITYVEKIHPGWLGYTGEVTSDKHELRYYTHATLTRINDSTVRITELPMNYATSKLKVKLDELKDDKLIKSFSNKSGKYHVDFTVRENGSSSVDSLKLKTSHPVTNMVLFDSKGALRKFDTTVDIIQEFCQYRLGVYVKRKDYQLAKLRNELMMARNKQRFINEVNSKEINIRQKKAVLFEILEERKYDRCAIKTNTPPSYRYLLDMKMWSFTDEFYDKLESEILKINSSVTELESTPVTEIWLDEIAQLEREYKKFAKEMLARR